MLGKMRKIGKRIEEIKPGEKITITEKIEDKDLLLYLGLTNDANPLYIQHDYASQTKYEKPIVPPVMLTGILASAVSKYLPGPGSHLLKQELEFLRPVYHYAVVTFLLEVSEVDVEKKTICISATGENENGERVIHGVFTVSPPAYELQTDERTRENA
ncbi:MaoC/PaaZ C-terminal domain-containing protein [Peribacillus kribbensis]|uniref:MaoC/PaaZ C-terminal domain-containing protein n=1 Tax=Peribacillus kribbensis TaxID=356658 RepID=UPI00040F126B|nr:MaoC/PaaZ C-terminal domain-containing protein [Peribacillus kribbensis]